MTLKDLVPPLALCRKIPKGKFEDSALVWSRRTSRFAPHEWVIPRGYAAEVSDIAPAPTLAEILEEFDHVVCASRFKRQWLVSYEDDPVDEDSSKWGNMIDIRDTDAPTAALKLWLELEAGK